MADEDSAPTASAPSAKTGVIGSYAAGLGGGLGLGLPPRSAKAGLRSTKLEADNPVPPAVSPLCTAAAGKRTRTHSTEDLLRIDGQEGISLSHVAEPLIRPFPGDPNGLPESMCAFVERVRAALAASLSFSKVDVMTRDGLYIHKRPIRSLGPSNPLSAGGTVFHHVLCYVRQKGQLTALDYGPASMDDVTSNFMQEVDARPVLCGDIGSSMVPQEDNAPFLWIDTPLHHLGDSVVSEAMEFVNSKRYHAINNNCIHVTDFLVRVLTGGLVKFSPLLYDSVCGSVPSVDPPMLMMVPLLMQRTWHQICDGSNLMKEFLVSHSFPPLIVQECDAKRHEDEAAASSGQHTPQPKDGELDQMHCDAGDAVTDDSKSFNSYNYWKALYLTQLHLVPDEV
mmetsp:Transcript_38733/g.109542  ORF Transcript_38733/g.109542 Transcript_38733/m.109542 type:complete len:395 (+) Transcript_38733:206-1390(+)|eukprot:CAMPEP_0117668806 /NCGR_PEP_ID=MMETSP0804-20121206/11763_1 /TAXON_ID=1074897 /ORGANISM="Tetraselmis astigmatica, Strain CCMP880" /LENGTH=394 /DNA_ID=CAMNT_0005476757 /DNA_START=188 /DNA_END=1372 /DNA_ORIENTATION=+